MRRVVFNIRFLLVVGVAMVMGVWPMAAQAAVAAPVLGTAAGFAVLAGTAVTCSTNAAITGDVGVSPRTVVTATSGCTINGTIHKNDAAAILANQDFAKAYVAIKTLACDQTLTTLDVSQTITPGVSCFDAGATATSKVLTLDGTANPNGIWIFKIGTKAAGALTGSSFTVTMAGGGNPCNVFWWVDAAASFTTSTLVGTILAGGLTGAVSFTDTSLTGRAWATRAVTMTGGSIVGCTAAGTVPGPCTKDGGKDTDEDADKSDENADKSNDTADRSSSVKSDSQGSHGDGKDENGMHSEHDGHDGCDSGDSNNHDHHNDNHDHHNNNDNKDNKKKSND
ncbi:MAG TPA: ice-binding family protein [Candidatus Dormibacteraeota bacterium]|nr:ice-binding family protein [Candidatus Dormibacteraeota bacterium]